MGLTRTQRAATLGVVLGLTCGWGAWGRVAHAQTPLSPPAGWTVQNRAGGARVFVPPDLAPGEVYSVAVYESASLDGKSLEAWLRAFAGPVGTAPGRLRTPLTVKTTEGRIVSGTGVYVGPQNKALGVLFLGVSLDGGANIHVTRTLFSEGGDLLKRYQDDNKAIMSAVVARAKREAGHNLVRVPAEVTRLMTPGGALVPGVYIGNQYARGELRYRMRVYLYANGEYRICDEHDHDYKDRFGDVEGVGTLTYNRNSGLINIDNQFDLDNSSINPEEEFCYYGRDAQNKPLIFQSEDVFGRTTTLRYAGPPTGRVSEDVLKARQTAADAEAKRYKWVTPPGKGVAASQVAGILHNYDVQVYSAGMNGMGTNIKDDAYLLLKNGLVHAGLRVPPDQLDATASRQHEPATWGRWRLHNGHYEVSWDGAPFQNLPGRKVLPAVSGTRLQGRWGTGSSSASMAGSSYALWGVTFTRDGRFLKDGSGGSSNGAFLQSGGAPAINSTYDDKGSYTSATGDNFTVGAGHKKNPNGNRAGTYTLNGYTLTLRYDNGNIVRLPFFFGDAAHSTLWLEGSQLARDTQSKGKG